MTKGKFHQLIAAFCCVIALTSCDQHDPADLVIDNWEFRHADSTVWHKATVPGNVFTDLLDNGLVPDPFYGKNELEFEWIEKATWHYRSIFPLQNWLESSSIVHPELHFDGIDTYASIFLNDSLILQTDNAYRHYTLDIGHLNTPLCTLEIILHSPIEKGQIILDQLPQVIPVSNELRPIGKQTSSVTRKPGYHYGWDWGPRLITSGLAGRVFIQDARQPTMDDVFISTRIQKDQTAVINIALDRPWPKGKWVIQEPKSSGHHQWVFEQIDDQHWEYTLDSPQLWWPRGMGKQPLYTVQWIPESNDVYALQCKIGIREIEWIRDKDEWGRSFECHINGHRVQIRGANVIPADFFANRAESKTPSVLQGAMDANMNALRVWGGAVYPNQNFFEFCDEHGILVWQDFMFACTMVRGDSIFQANVSQEAEEQVKRLRNHPSLALWCGNNESQKAWNTWGWQELYNLHGIDSAKVYEAYDTLFHSILPRVVSEHTNTTYWPSSPTPDYQWKWNTNERNSETEKFSGDEHAWHVWFDTLDFDYFSQHQGRFASEYGLQSLPHSQTLHDVGIQTFGDPELQFRQRSKMEWLKPGLDGWGMMRIYARRYTADPASKNTPEAEALDRWIYLTQLTQSIGLREALERHRNSQGKYSGSMYWQLNDVWPTPSWSTIDHAGRWKLAHHAVREANKDCRIIINHWDSIGFSVTAFPDIPSPCESSTISLALLDQHGDTLKTMTRETTIAAFERLQLSLATNRAEFPTACFVRWMWKASNGEIIDYGEYLMEKPSNIHWPQAQIQMKIDRNKVTLTSNEMAFGVRLSTPLAGHFDCNGLTLFPNESVTVSFFPDDAISELDPGQLTIEHFAQFQ
ncbi:MAG: beta-mannosidase [Flavobacteriales bacterium]